MLEREKPSRDVDDRPLDLEWHIRTNAGMMGVIPIWRVWEIVDGPEMKVIREAFADGLQSFFAGTKSKREGFTPDRFTVDCYGYLL